MLFTVAPVKMRSLASWEVRWCQSQLLHRSHVRLYSLSLNIYIYMLSERKNKKWARALTDDTLYGEEGFDKFFGKHDVSYRAASSFSSSSSSTSFWDACYERRWPGGQYPVC